MDLSSEDKTRKRRAAGDDETDGVLDESGTGTPSGAAAPTRSRPLTFRPAIDDPVQLTNFLKGVHQKYLFQRGSILERLSAQSQGGETALNASAVLPLRPPTAAVASAKGDMSMEASLPVSNREEAEFPPTTARRRRQRAGNNASLLRAKSIDFHAPDPEQEAPPNETEEERRRRKERINGRRKRAKKMIEIDFLNEQYHKLKGANDKLKSENEAFRERIAMLKNLQDSGLIKAKPVPASNKAVVTEGLLQQGDKDEDERKPAAIPQQRTPAPLFQYALPPAAMSLRAARDVALNRPQEESKEAFAQPQFVGQERLDVVGLAGASIAGSLTSTRPSAPLWMSLAGFAGASPFVQQQQTLPQASIAAALLFQQQQQQQARNFATAAAAAQSIANAQALSPMQQIYQNLFALQQQQQNQGQSSQSSPSQQPGGPNQPQDHRFRQPPTG
ncbi:expressed unknown protein [Seminavis robusta]|uniref:BZIP domain-containing protein n=1 Tax=Seminavis robusta TaxID=568900 RepID=A0A9N8EV46_9STRA|nr:expressed unknown protein [Seminavis robusta]|eukprot:Sro1705_g292460.1 n/a (446) ;mRNA; f:16706-18043